MSSAGDASAPRRSTLALGIVTDGPARHVEATVEALRGVVDEVVMLIDDRVPAEDVATLAGVADASRMITFGDPEAHPAELHDLASSDWVLQLDDDEFPSSALLRRLPSLLADDRFAKWAIRRVWVFPDPEGWLDEVPWAPDFQLRLMRRGTAGAREESTVGYVDEGVYHLDCVVSTQEERQVKALLRDVMGPGVQLAGQHPMHVRFEPERYATRPPATVPRKDAASLRALLSRRRRP